MKSKAVVVRAGAAAIVAGAALLTGSEPAHAGRGLGGLVADLIQNPVQTVIILAVIVPGVVAWEFIKKKRATGT